ncbi:hypothetical protein HK104_001824 [Borealophlyctis nickersoniae]|nr:hypothetical protein HK104_001824 [Borealophlyctis nickersoniae]
MAERSGSRPIRNTNVEGKIRKEGFNPTGQNSPPTATESVGSGSRGVQDIRRKSSGVTDAVLSDQFRSASSSSLPKTISPSAGSPSAGSLFGRSPNKRTSISQGGSSFEAKLFPDRYATRLSPKAADENVDKRPEEKESADGEKGHGKEGGGKQKDAETQEGKTTAGGNAGEGAAGGEKKPSKAERKAAKRAALASGSGNAAASGGASGSGGPGGPTGASGSGHPQAGGAERKSQKQMTKAERRELQEKQRAEKQARIEAGLPPRPKPDAKPSSGAGPSTPSATSRQSSTPELHVSTARAKSENQPAPSYPTLAIFSHLPPFTKASPAHDVRADGANTNIHPMVEVLNLKFSEWVIAGGNARCVAMMLVFKQVISDYETPRGTSLQHNLITHIGKQVDYLTKYRSLAASMKTAIRFVKSAIVNVSIDMPDEDAKVHLCEKIDEFVRERIEFADKAIVDSELNSGRIKDGDVIMVYAKSSVVLQLLLAAHKKGTNFRVIVIDSRPKVEGRAMAQALGNAGISVTYGWLNSLAYVMKVVTKCYLGASAIFNNGGVLSRLGTAVVAMSAKNANKPVIVLCETYKFMDTVRLDSIVWNELGDPTELSIIGNRGASPPSSTTRPKPPKTILGDDPTLTLVNLHYDLTPPTFVDLIMCEFGPIAPDGVGAMIRFAADREG